MSFDSKTSRDFRLLLRSLHDLLHSGTVYDHNAVVAELDAVEQLISLLVRGF